VLEQYYEAIKEAVLQKTENRIKLYTFDEMGALFNQILANEVERSSISYPFIVLKCRENYVADKREYQYEDQGETQTQMIDFINSFPCELKVELVAYAENIQDLISTEEYLTALANEETTIVLNDKTPSRRVRFTISKDNDVDIVRDSANNATLGKQLCFTNITFKAKGCVIFSKGYHPAELALDKDVQKEVLNQVIIAISYHAELSDKLDSMRPDWYTPERIDIKPDLRDSVKKALEKINENYERTQKRIPSKEETDIAQEDEALWKNIKNTLLALIPEYKDEEFQRELGFSSYKYLQEYLTEMNEHDCDIKKAIEFFNKRKDEFDQKIKDEKQKLIDEEKRIENEKYENERKEKMLESLGDETINHYTNAVIDYFKNLLDDESILIYDGTSDEKLKKKLSEKDEKSPFIIVKCYYDYSYDDTIFYNVDQNGNRIAYNFNAYAMPIRLRYCVIINSENAKEISQVIDNATENNLTILLNDFYFPEQQNQITLSKSNYSIEDELASWTNNDPTAVLDLSEGAQEFKNHFHDNHKVFSFKSTTANTYIHKKYIAEDLKYNHDLQLNLLRELEYITIIHARLTGEALRRLENDYKELVQPSGSLGTALLGLLDTAEYKSLKTDFRCRRPIDRNKFNNALNKITEAYPILYDRMMQGWTVTQIKSEMESLVKQYEIHMNDIYEMLDIPDRIKPVGFKTEYLGRAVIAIKHYIVKMQNEYETIERAIRSYRIDLLNEEVKKQKEREARAEAARYEQPYSYESSSGGGGGILESTVGTYLGTRGIRREEKKQTEIMREQLKLQEEAKRQADADRRHQQWENNYRRSQIIRENQERRRKGLPELPIPPGDYR